jgi:Uma2 family endonuclease
MTRRRFTVDEYDRVEVYRGPREGEYLSLQTLERDASITPIAFPDLTLSCADILG